MSSFNTKYFYQNTDLADFTVYTDFPLRRVKRKWEIRVI